MYAIMIQGNPILRYLHLQTAHRVPNTILIFNSSRVSRSLIAPKPKHPPLKPPLSLDMTITITITNCSTYTHR